MAHPARVPMVSCTWTGRPADPPSAERGREAGGFAAGRRRTHGPPPAPASQHYGPMQRRHSAYTVFVGSSQPSGPGGAGWVGRLEAWRLGPLASTGRAHGPCRGACGTVTGVCDAPGRVAHGGCMLHVACRVPVPGGGRGGSRRGRGLGSLGPPSEEGRGGSVRGREGEGRGGRGGSRRGSRRGMAGWLAHTWLGYLRRVGYMRGPAT